MRSALFDRLIKSFFGASPLVVTAWIGLVVLGAGLLVLMYTRWGRFNALGKCLVLSALAHLLLAGYSMTIYVVPYAAMLPEREIRVSLLKDCDRDERSDPVQSPHPSTPPLVPPTPANDEWRVGATEHSHSVPALLTGEIRPVPQPEHVGDADVRVVTPTADSAEHPIAERGAAGPWRPRQPAVDAPPPQPHPLPALYQMRVSPDRGRIAKAQGASPQVEVAVRAALGWLAENQASDGRWSSSRHGGGQETLEAGRDRHGAGNQADTGVTGLALLSFAAAGQTHLEGEHRDAVRRGVEFLLIAQAPDGSLGGSGSTYEFMYCHGIASFALSEILGMTDDERIRGPVKRAVAYTLAAQDPVGGGWRYQPREPGDTSQLGWQVMALKSAELAGIPVPNQVWVGVRRFLSSVSTGWYGGIASYRPGERPSRTMTAEALACRQFLGLAADHPIASEAVDFLLGQLPGEGNRDLYYWYYGTAAMYQVQGIPWSTWNAALQQELLARQSKQGELSGSWDPVTRWDGYGGRVYSTALTTLCLESFWRFAPLSTRVPLQADLQSPDQPRR